VSLALRKAEEDLGTTLLTRGPTGVSPTPEGRRLLEDTRVALQRLDQAMNVSPEVARRIEFPHLRAFLAVAQAEGVGSGARRLGAPQSAVSARIASLETLLSRQLFVRHRAGVDLTPAGAALARALPPAVAAIDDAIDRARTPTRELSLAVFPYMLEPLNNLLSDLRDRQPEIRAHICVVDFTTQLDVLHCGRADAALLTFTPSDPTLELQPLSRHRTYVIVSVGHRLAALPTVTFDDIAQEPWPTLPPGCPVEFADFYYMTARRGGRPPLIPEKVTTPDDVVTLVAAGQIIATVPDYLVTTARAVPGVTVIPFVDSDPFVLTLARRRLAHRSPAVEWLFEIAANRWNRK
jgi:DNA-binding transcriptional LysR family regulator